METQTQHRKLSKSSGGVRDRSEKMRIAIAKLTNQHAYSGRVTFFDGSSLSFRGLVYIGERDGLERTQHGYYADGKRVLLRSIENIYLHGSNGIESRLSLSGRT